MTKEQKLLNHVQIADSRMRELFGFYWHRRHAGISQERSVELVKEIKTGEKIIKSMERIKK